MLKNWRVDVRVFMTYFRARLQPAALIVFCGAWDLLGPMVRKSREFSRGSPLNPLSSLQTQSNTRMKVRVIQLWFVFVGICERLSRRL
jgi:hypothetical protein